MGCLGACSRRWGCFRRRRRRMFRDRRLFLRIILPRRGISRHRRHATNRILRTESTSLMREYCLPGPRIYPRSSGTTVNRPRKSVSAVGADDWASLMFCSAYVQDQALALRRGRVAGRQEAQTPETCSASDASNPRKRGGSERDGGGRDRVCRCDSRYVIVNDVAPY
jgi:hypothetical protein